MDLNKILTDLNLGKISKLSESDLKEYTTIFNSTKNENPDIILLIKIAAISNLTQFEERIASILYPEDPNVDYDTLIPTVIRCLFYAWGLWEKYFEQVNKILIGEYDNFIGGKDYNSWAKYCILVEYLSYLKENNNTPITEMILTQLNKIKSNPSEYSEYLNSLINTSDLRKRFPQEFIKYKL
jgi:hypothetical protein